MWANLIGRGLADAGVDVRVGVSVRALRRPDPDGPVTLELDDDTELQVDEVLFATGRAPLTDYIGLETVGLTPGSWLDVDDTCRVRAIDDGWLYAAGDVNHRALLTHQGKYQARIAGAAIGARAAGTPLDTAPWGVHATTADHHAVPQAFFTDPEAAAVGLTAEQAAQARSPGAHGRRRNRRRRHGSQALRGRVYRAGAHGGRRGSGAICSA